MGQSEVWKSLRTDSRKHALRRLPAVMAQLELLFEKLRQSAGLTVDSTLLEPLLDDLNISEGRLSVIQKPGLGHEFVPSTKMAGLSLGEAYQRYLDDPTHAWTTSTRQAYETTRCLAVSVLGFKTPIRDITRVQTQELVEVLRFLPRNASKLLPNLSPREASDRARTQTKVERISAANANAYLGNFSSFMNWAVAEEFVDRNCRATIRVRKRVNQDENPVWGERRRA